MVEKFGADALRIYEMFMAPFEQDIQWSTDGLVGARRFLNRLWKLYQKTYEPSTAFKDNDDALDRALHRTIKLVGERIESFRFNTMISALMEFANLLTERQQNNQWKTATFHRSLEKMIVLLAPAAPHITEELWQLTGHQGSVHQQAWPVWDPAMIEDALVEIPVQIDGKVRHLITISLDAGESEVEALVLSVPRIQQFISDQEIVKKVYVPGKVFNIVTRRS
jgi:leucyl-tRNA synthetase